jgi:hypothetical protein
MAFFRTAVGVRPPARLNASKCRTAGKFSTTTVASDSASLANSDGTSPEEDQLNVGPCIDLEATMNGLIYLIGLIVVIMFILSFLGLR